MKGFPIYSCCSASCVITWLKFTHFAGYSLFQPQRCFNHLSSPPHTLLVHCILWPLPPQLTFAVFLLLLLTNHACLALCKVADDHTRLSFQRWHFPHEMWWPHITSSSFMKVQVGPTSSAVGARRQWRSAVMVEHRVTGFRMQGDIGDYGWDWDGVVVVLYYAAGSAEPRICWIPFFLQFQGHSTSERPLVPSYCPGLHTMKDFMMHCSSETSWGHRAMAHQDVPFHCNH